jgi:Na+/H+ antiporter NhaD/arsenite permease-like protein
MPDYLRVIPFFALLAAIAAGPLLARDWWNRNYPWVAFALALLTGFDEAIGHGRGDRLEHAAIEYANFILLIGALFVVSGGIVIRIPGRSTPLENVSTLAIGALLASAVGTTGASLLLIRPYLRNNRYRLSAHHVAFFIFIVANVGGALTPLGDPPLTLAFLRGVPFGWFAANAAGPWLVAVSLLLAIFYFIDRRSYARVDAELRARIEDEVEETSIRGAHNLLFAGVVIGTVLVEMPALLRDALLVLAAGASYLLTSRSIHEHNRFRFLPLGEVAILFGAIFVTMIPVLDAAQRAAAGVRLAPGWMYWGTGLLSSILDNAPTFLAALGAVCGAAGVDAGNRADVAALAARAPVSLLAPAIGAVFFGALTYIGNAPNLMVRAIAEHEGVRVPHFAGYIVRFSLPILLPVLIVVWLFYFL